MNREDADALAKRIAKSWRTTIPWDEWSNYLCGLPDPDIAHQAFVALFEREARPKEFGDKYRELARAVEPLQTAEVEPSGPRLSRAEVAAILERNGAGWALRKETA